jgi:hypothetical protein
MLDEAGAKIEIFSERMAGLAVRLRAAHRAAAGSDSALDKYRPHPIVG